MKLEIFGMPLNEVLNIIEKVQSGTMDNKLCYIRQRSPRYEVVIAVKKYLPEKGLELPEEMPPNLDAVLRYCPVICVDAGRAVSAYRLIVTDNRHELTLKDRKGIVTYCKNCEEDNFWRHHQRLI
jgi:hypothetical protein